MTSEPPTRSRVLAGAFVGYFCGAIYTFLLVIGFVSAKALFDGSADGLAERLADGGTIAGLGLMIAPLAPFVALILLPLLAAIAWLASLATAHMLAGTKGPPSTRRNMALVCGALTGLALWAASLLARESELAMVGALWLLPAPLAMLSVNWFLFADFDRLGYRER